MRVEPGRGGETWALGPALAPDEPFPFVCAGCGGCCRGRRDLVLSGYDLYRIARRLRLSPRIAARAFCKEYIAPQSPKRVVKDFLIKFTKKLQKKCQKQILAPDTFADGLFAPA